MTHRTEQVETEWHRQTTHVGMWPCQAEHVNTVSNQRKDVWSDSAPLRGKNIHMPAGHCAIKKYIYKSDKYAFSFSFLLINLKEQPIIFEHNQ